MVSIANVQGLSDGNQILGTFPNLIQSEIIFQGKNNILYCEPGVTLSESSLNFRGDNSVIYLGHSRYEYKLEAYVHNDNVLHIGTGNYFNKTAQIILSEQRHCFIGDRCDFAWGICIRNADPHLIYDCSTRTRTNPTRSIYIGDHVWIGQDCLLLKGTRIDSGSIIGSRAVITGSNIPHNTMWVGVPAKQIKEEVFWDGSTVHKWKEEMTAASHHYDDFLSYTAKDTNYDEWIYEYVESESIEYSEIGDNLSNSETSQDKLDYLLRLNESKTKNRFVHKQL